MQDASQGMQDASPLNKQEAKREITLEDVIEAFQKEMHAYWLELSQIRDRVARFDRAFETMFREEAEMRLGLGGHGGVAGKALQMSELENLKYQVRKNRGEL